MHRIAALAIAALVGSASPAWAQGKTVYVSPSGANDKSGASPAEAVKGIWKGIELAGAGGTVKIAEGDYPGRADSGLLEVTESVTLLGGYSKDFASREPFVRRSRLVGSNEGKTPLRLEAADGVTIVADGLHVNGESVNDYSSGKLSFREAQVPLILVKTRGKRSGVTVRNCLLLNGSNCAIIADADTGPVVISNCVIVGARIAAVEVGTNTRASVTVENCTLLASWRNGQRPTWPYTDGHAVKVTGQRGEVKVRGCLMGLAPDAAVRNVDGRNKMISLSGNAIIEGGKFYLTQINNKAFEPGPDEMADADLLDNRDNKVLEGKLGIADLFRRKLETTYSGLVTDEDAAALLPSEKMPAGYGAKAVKE